MQRRSHVAKMDCSVNLSGIYFTHPSGKEPIESILKRVCQSVLVKLPIGYARLASLASSRVTSCNSSSTTSGPFHCLYKQQVEKYSGWSLTRWMSQAAVMQLPCLVPRWKRLSPLP